MGGGGFGLPQRGNRSQPSMVGSGSSTCPLTRRLRLGTDCANLFPCPRSVTSQGELEISHAGSIYTAEIGQSSSRGPLHPPRPCGETPSSPAHPAINSRKTEAQIARSTFKTFCVLKEKEISGAHDQSDSRAAFVSCDYKERAFWPNLHQGPASRSSVHLRST